MNYTRQQLEQLADLGVLPSSLGIGIEGDTSIQFINNGSIEDETGFYGFYDEDGVSDDGEVILSRIRCLNSVLTRKKKLQTRLSFTKAKFLVLLRKKGFFSSL